MNDQLTKTELRRLKADLVFKGIPQAEIALQAHVSRSMVAAVLNGRKRSARVLSIILAALKKEAA